MGAVIEGTVSTGSAVVELARRADAGVSTEDEGFGAIAGIVAVIDHKRQGTVVADIVVHADVAVVWRGALVAEIIVEGRVGWAHAGILVAVEREGFLTGGTDVVLETVDAELDLALVTYSVVFGSSFRADTGGVDFLISGWTSTSSSVFSGDQTAQALRADSIGLAQIAVRDLAVVAVIVEQSGGGRAETDVLFFQKLETFVAGRADTLLLTQGAVADVTAHAAGVVDSFSIVAAAAGIFIDESIHALPTDIGRGTVDTVVNFTQHAGILILDGVVGAGTGRIHNHISVIWAIASPVPLKDESGETIHAGVGLIALVTVVYIALDTDIVVEDPSSSADAAAVLQNEGLRAYTFSGVAVQDEGIVTSFTNKLRCALVAEVNIAGQTFKFVDIVGLRTNASIAGLDEIRTALASSIDHHEGS